jgi:hypothetical protein
LAQHVLIQKSFHLLYLVTPRRLTRKGVPFLVVEHQLCHAALTPQGLGKVNGLLNPHHVVLPPVE